MAGRCPLTPASICEHLARGAGLSPVYVLIGNDERAKREVTTAFAEIVEEDFRPFNVERLYGLETSMAGVLDAARTLPWMGERRVIIVQQADRLLNPKARKGKLSDPAVTESGEDEAGDGEATEGGWQLLQAYLEAPQAHAVIVFLAESVHQKRLDTMMRRGASVVECGVSEEKGAYAAWVRARVDHEGVRFAPDALQELVTRAGMDEARLYADTDRVLAYVGERKVVTRADVTEATSEASLQSEWAVVNAVLDGETGKALRQLALMFEASHLPENVEALRILGQLRWMVTAPPPRDRFPKARLRQAVESLFRTDLALKTSAGDARILLERLVVELCGGEQPQRPARAAGSRTDPGPGQRSR